MKKMKSHICITVCLIALFTYSCSDFLEPEVFSETAPDNLFKSLAGVESILFGAYANANEMAANSSANILGIEESMGDNGYVIAAWTRNYQTYILDPSNIHGFYWNSPYQAIRNANIILENIENASITESSKQLIKAEATFIRAISYYRLFMRFGPVPLRINSLQELEIPRSTEQEMIDFIEDELLKAYSDLPRSGEQSAWGRAHKGAAQGFLMQLYLNTKQWQKAANASKNIIDMNTYGLFPDYFSLFFVANRGNEEMIWTRVARADIGREQSNAFMNFAYPHSPSPFASHPRTGLMFPATARNFDDSKFYVFDSWYDSFEIGDERKSLIITEYIGRNGNLINLANNSDPNIGRTPFKYWPDAGADGPGYGNDIPLIRYADVLLSRAEALNELNGPNQESINLINDVRNRAGATELQLADFTSKDELRDHILEERGWEFWWEAKRREDLVRHNKLIVRAQERGLPAQSHHVVLPIPQFAIDANPALKQTAGY